MINIKSKSSELNDYRSHTIELKPNSQMRDYIEGCLGYGRYIYNKCIVKLKESDVYLFHYDLKNKIDNSQEKWEQKYPSDMRDTATDRFWKAIERCTIYKETTHAEFPKFKSKYESFQSFTYNPTKSKGIILFDKNNPKKFKPGFGRYCKIDPKYRYIRMTEKLRFKGKVKLVHIYKEYDRYFANFVVEVDKNDLYTNEYKIKKSKQNKQPIKKKDFVGIDLGIRTFIQDSDGNYLTHITKYPQVDKLIEEAEQYQSIMSRKHVKGKHLNEQSKNYHKTRTKFMRILRKIANIKDNFYHQLTRWYSDRYTNIVLEDLDNKEMRKRREDSKQESIGKVVRPLVAQISYFKLKKLFDEKSHLVLIDKWYPSTQRCSHCGNTKKGKDKLELDQKVYVCNVCGLIINRDYNAALNIKMEGISKELSQGMT